MFRFIIFLIIVAVIATIFGERIWRWVRSIGQFGYRKEDEQYQKFDKKLNPQEETSTKKKTKKSVKKSINRKRKKK